jgi:hypothetical protein
LDISFRSFFSYFVRRVRLATVMGKRQLKSRRGYKEGPRPDSKYRKSRTDDIDREGLECRVGVGDEVNEVGLEPLSGLGSGDLSIRTTAHGVVAGSAGVGGTIGFSSWLDPDDGIDVRRAGASGWVGTETSVLDVAPVTPGRSDVLLTGTALINDELSVPSARGEHRSQGVDVVDLIVVVIALGDWVGGSSTEGIVVGNVGGKTTDV